jgi:DNA-binding MarR family transcriptional regulator
VEVETAALRQSRRRRSDRFLKGPIPLHLIAAAARLPGRALAVLLAVHHQMTLAGKPSVSLPSGLLAEFGIDRDAKARVLHQLEQAGLIRVERTLGRAARVRLARAKRSVEDAHG